MVKEYEGLSKLEKARFIDLLKKYMMTLMSWIKKKKGQICPCTKILKIKKCPLTIKVSSDYK